MSRRPLRPAPGLVLSLSLLSLNAAQAAELQGPTLPTPQSSDPASVPAPQPTPALPRNAVAGESPRVRIEAVQLQGCQVLDATTLVAQLGPLPGEPIDLAGMEALAQQVARLYKRAGYPFTVVLVPPQRIAQGVLQLQVIEGRLGKVSVSGADPLTPGAQPFVEAGLPLGQPIREDQLERTMLLIDDQPGFSLRPVLRPGQAPGEGDLLVQVDRSDTHMADVSLDNFGSSSTGAYRLKGSVAFNSPFIFGDRLSLSALTTSDHMSLGGVDYDRPLGARGWRGLVGWSRTSYQLGGHFSALDASGYAEVATLKASYAVLRSQQANVSTAVSLQHKTLQDRFGSVDLTRDKASDLLILSAQFDHRDTWLGGGVVYGQASWTQGRLHLDSATSAIDSQTAHTGGGFGKFNLDLARIQRISGPWNAYGRLTVQWAPQNLDSSEKYGLGGYLGVRAYPMGEGTGDRGWLVQTELRWSLGEFTPYLLADAGQMTANARPWDDGSHTRRSLAGAGLGLRWAQGAWNAEAALAARVVGHAPTADTDNAAVRGWVMVNRHFD